MDFPTPLVRGRLIQRYKRFLADIELEDGPVITAHVANPGSMLALAAPGAAVWLSDSANPKRKLRYSWELQETPDGALVGVNTHHANRLVAEALSAGAIAELAGYAAVRPEVKYGADSRVDFLLTDPGKPDCWVEAKSVTLSRQAGLAEWPDCTSTRAAKHLRELQAIVARGDRAVVLFVVQRNDCDTVGVAGDLDPTFAAELQRAVAAGVEVVTYGCVMTTEAISLSRRLDWRGD